MQAVAALDARAHFSPPTALPSSSSSRLRLASLSARRYTLPHFEARAAAAHGPLLARLGVPTSRHHGPGDCLPPLDHEALFWYPASADRPVTVEYASDMPGSGFPPGPAARSAQGQQPAHVGKTAWNMRAAARGPGSLLRFMRDEVAGVTMPMLYVYGGEVNALEAFATLGKKTTLLSPELLVGSGVPCCRLVQNAGEFVVIFPGSYHCGFSHGIN